MEEQREHLRVVVKDPIFDQIQQQRLKKHMESIQKLRTFDKKSNSHYLLAPHPTSSLD